MTSGHFGGGGGGGGHVPLLPTPGSGPAKWVYLQQQFPISRIIKVQV